MSSMRHLESPRRSQSQIRINTCPEIEPDFVGDAFKSRFNAKCVTIPMDSQNMSYNVGQAKSQAQEKTSNMMDKASNAA
ncbi:hypothetical protein Fmac_016549 [Flemingia macrophylla]|uniref:Uncharacterized protein n=1 Tax=Flemingia macrophylla TaxID=520843 RepID=A0ABD1MHN2_9FABA